MGRPGAPPGPRPNAWKSGPDPLTHQKYRAFIQQRNQAQFRDESWQLTFEQWQAIWGDLFSQRGRRGQDLCLTRHDLEGAWDQDNAVLMSRAEHMRRCGTRSQRSEDV